MVENSTADREVSGSIALARWLNADGRHSKTTSIFYGKSNMKNGAVINW